MSNMIPSGSSEDSNANASSGPTPESTIGNWVGRRLGDYQILRKLGRGGMADVYAARHLSLGRDVAVKVLRRDFARDADYVARFRREARAAAKLSHPNIVAVYDVGDTSEAHYIVQELIDGQNLRETLDRDGPISPDEAIEVLAAVGKALEAAAEAGITHRDIKPENIMRSARGEIKVADFGLARLDLGSDDSRAALTQAGLTLGTPRYMSPEQVQGKPVDVRSDLYSLGVSMYHLLSGSPPFAADEPLALAVMHLHETPRPLDHCRTIRDSSGEPDLPEWLIAVIHRLMAKQPDDRFQTPTDLLEAIGDQAQWNPAFSHSATGAISATVRLQRAADSVAKSKRNRWARIAMVLLLPFIFAAAAFGAARLHHESVGVKDLLQSTEVPMGTSVQHQYLIAATRNDEAGWRSVGENFPPDESTTNARYYTKSKLQWSRWLIEHGRVDEADRLLQELLSDPKTDKLHQILALVTQVQSGVFDDDPASLATAKNQLSGLAKELNENDAQAIDLLKRTIDSNVRMQLGLDI